MKINKVTVGKKEKINILEIDIRKSYEHLKQDKIKDFYGINKEEIDPFAEWLLKNMFRDVLLMKDLYELLPDGDYNETIIDVKRKIFLTIKKKDKL